MQKTLRIVGLLALMIGMGTAHAQELSRKEKCDIKKEIRPYMKDPAKWVAMKQTQDSTVNALQTRIDSLNIVLEAAQVANAILKTKVAHMEQKYQQLLDSMPSLLPPKGTVYQVQMGYYQQLDLVSFNNKLKVIKAEESGGAKRYVIGYFDAALDALQFASDMKALGIDDAFVTQYIDGERNMEYDAFAELAD